MAPQYRRSRSKKQERVTKVRICRPVSSVSLKMTRKANKSSDFASQYRRSRTKKQERNPKVKIRRPSILDLLKKKQERVTKVNIWRPSIVDLVQKNKKG